MGFHCESGHLKRTEFEIWDCPEKKKKPGHGQPGHLVATYDMVQTESDGY